MKQQFQAQGSGCVQQGAASLSELQRLHGEFRHPVLMQRPVSGQLSLMPVAE